MSYQIIYDGFAVKTSKGYMLMIENGSNNCYTANGRRERNIWSLNIYDSQNLFYENADEAIKHIDRKTFEGGNIQMCRGRVDDFVKRCFKHTIDIQKLLDNGALSYSYYDKNYKTQIVKPKTEEEVFEYLNSMRYPSLMCDTVCFMY
jgi:hypothetical protein